MLRFYIMYVFVYVLVLIPPHVFFGVFSDSYDFKSLRCVFLVLEGFYKSGFNILSLLVTYSQSVYELPTLKEYLGCAVGLWQRRR